MTITGTIYGVILNDIAERISLAAAFEGKPYLSPPKAPVLYVKPRGCATTGDTSVALPQGIAELNAASTIALLFERDARMVAESEAWATIGAASLAVDLSVPQGDYYRPAIAQRCRDGFLPLGRLASPSLPDTIVTIIDGVEAHRWSTERLVRPAAQLISDLSSFMTLRAGDLLLVGLPGDAPRVRAGQSIRVEAQGLPALTAMIGGNRS